MGHVGDVQPSGGHGSCHQDWLVAGAEVEQGFLPFSLKPDDKIYLPLKGWPKEYMSPNLAASFNKMSKSTHVLNKNIPKKQSPVSMDTGSGQTLSREVGREEALRSLLGHVLVLHHLLDLGHEPHVQHPVSLVQDEVVALG